MLIIHYVIIFIIMKNTIYYIIHYSEVRDIFIYLLKFEDFIYYRHLLFTVLLESF